jgi:hypothetical protein
VFLVREDFVLHGQKGAAGVDQIDAGQAIFQGDFLGAQVLLDGQRVVGAAFHRRVVGDDHAFDAVNAADAGDHRRRRHIAAIHVVSGELADLKKRRAGIKQAADAFARQQLAAREVLWRAASGPPRAILSTFSCRSATTVRMASTLA